MNCSEENLFLSEQREGDRAQSNELTRGPPDFVEHFRL